MKHLFYPLFLICITLANAGDYQMFYSNQKAIFRSSSNNHITLRFDSVNYEDIDSIYFPAPTAGEDFYYQDSLPQISSFVGEEIIVKPNGRTILHSVLRDTLVIETLASTGLPWLAYEDSTIKIFLEVKSIENESFLGLTDSVKTIGISEAYADGELTNRFDNFIEFKISKNYGLIKTPSVKLLNYESEFEPYFFEEVYELAGLESPEVGIQDFTSKDIFDFEVGDELHVQEYVKYEGPSTPGQPTLSETTYNKISTILTKQLYDDSVTYTIEERIGTIQLTQQNFDSPEIVTYDFSLDTITKTFLYHSFEYQHLNNNVGEVVVHSDNYIESISNINVFADGDYLGLNSKNLAMTSYYISSDGAVFTREMIIDGLGGNDEFYLKGLGGPYHYDAEEGGNTMDFYTHTNLLVYAKKGDWTIGTPLTIVGNEQTKQYDNTISVYPNPVSDVVRIDSDASYSKATLSDLNGQVLFETTITDRLEIPSFISNGVYVLQLSGSKTISTIKIEVIR